MKRMITPAAVVLFIGIGSMSAQAGCLTGAAVGGAAGHVAGHHGVLGAAAGCAVGHHEANKSRAQKATQNQPAGNTGNGATDTTTKSPQ